MLIFIAFQFILFISYLTLLSARALSGLERACIAIFLSLITTIYAPQASSLLLGTLNIWAMLGLSFIPLLFLFFHERRQLSLASIRGCFSQSLASVQPLTNEIIHSWYLMALLLLTLGASILVIWVFTNFSNFGWDGWTYHSSAMAWFNQQDVITTSMPLMKWVTSYPKNVEFLSLWIFKFSGNDRLIDGANFLIHLAVLPFAYGVGRHTNLSRTWSLAAALIYFLTPYVIVQSWSTYIDQALTDSIVMVLFFYLSWTGSTEDKRFFWSVLLGLGLGHLAQTKGTGFHVIVIVGGMLVIREIIEGRTRKLVKQLMVIGATTILTGAGWYVKNWYIHGNPVDPYEITLPGTALVLFPGSIPRPIETNAGTKKLSPRRLLTQFSERWSQVPSIDNRKGGWGPHYFFLALPAMAIVLLQGNRNIRWLVLFVIAHFFVLQPISFMARFSLTLPFVGAVAFGYMAQEILRTRPWHGFLTLISIALLVLGLLPTLAILDNLSNYKGSGKPYYNIHWGWRRFALINHKPGARIGIVSLESRSDNPLWYFYFGPNWANHVELFDSKQASTYDYIICGLSSQRCSDIRALSSHHSVMIERNIEVFERND